MWGPRSISGGRLVSTFSTSPTRRSQAQNSRRITQCMIELKLRPVVFVDGDEILAVGEVELLQRRHGFLWTADELELVARAADLPKPLRVPANVMSASFTSVSASGIASLRPFDLGMSLDHFLGHAVLEV